MPNERIVAFIDLGTNSARLLLVAIAADGSTTTLVQQKEVVRLGEGGFADRRLRDDAMDRAVAACGRFAELARARGASEIIAVATSAAREARNRAALVERLRCETGINLRIIPGREEARLIYLGVRSGVSLDDRTALFIDIGGGSTEIILGTQREHLFLDSLKLGAIRLTSMFFEPGFDGPVSAAAYRRLTTHVRTATARGVQALQGREIDFAIGSSGTAQNLLDITIRRGLERPARRDDAVARRDLCATIRELCALPLADRRNVPGLNPDRADIIIAGAAILETLLRELRIERLRSSDRGLREGLLVECVSRLQAAAPPPGA